MEPLSLTAAAVLEFLAIARDIFQLCSSVHRLVVGREDDHPRIICKHSDEATQIQGANAFCSPRIDVKSDCGPRSLPGLARNRPSKAEEPIVAISEHSSCSISLRECEH